MLLARCGCDRRRGRSRTGSRSPRATRRSRRHRSRVCSLAIGDGRLSSAGVNRRSNPVVAQIVAVSCERPSANAFGIRTSAIATRGLGMSATMHNRSMIECRSGASAGETSRAPMAFSAILSEANIWTAKKAAAMTSTIASPAPAAIGDSDEDDVHEPKQEHRQRHPDLQAGVATENVRRDIMLVQRSPT